MKNILTLQNILTAFIISLFAITTFYLLFQFIAVSIDKAEIVECYEWKDQSKQYSGFYLASWQAEQCERHGVQIDAPVL